MTMKSQTQHTPGPWMAAAGPSSVVGWPVVAQRGQSICSLSWLGKQPDGVSDERFAAYRAEVHANGHLIAAAPDLLAALIKVVAIADRKTDEFDAARAAIAKALEGKAP